MRFPAAFVQLLLVLPCVAQFSMGHRMGIGWSHWKVSGGSGNVAADWNEEQEPLSGFYFEVPVEYRVTARLRAVSGLGFIQKGFQYGDSKEQVRVGYVQIPFGVGYALHSGRFAVQPELGAVYGLNMRGYQRWNYGDEDGTWFSSPVGRRGEAGYGYWMPRDEWALQGRLGMSWAFRRSHVSLSAGYQHGLSNAMVQFVNPYASFDDPEGTADPAIPEKALQRTVMLSLSYMLELGSKGHAKADSLAPDTVPSAFRIGQRFGMAQASMAFHSAIPEEQARVAEGATPILGVTTALVARLRLSTHWSLQPELAFTQRGWFCQWWTRPTTRNDQLRMNYLELPLLVRCELGAGRIRPFVLAGPVIARAVGGHHIVVIDSPSHGEIGFPESIRFDDVPDIGVFPLYDLSAVVGVGASFSMGCSELYIDLRYQRSATDLVTDEYGFLDDPEAVAKHRVWMLSTGYLIPW